MLNRIKEIIGKVEKDWSINLSSPELKECYIVEKQHVAGFKYDKVINEIVNYIENYIKNNSYTKRKGILGIEGGYWETTIPNEITQQIDFINNLTIKVTIEDFKKDKTNANTFGTGETHHYKFNDIIDNKINNNTILVNGVSFNKMLSDYSVRNNLYHELNHAYEDYKRLQKININNKGLSMYNLTGEVNNFLHTVKNSGKDENTQRFHDICYRLFDKRELSAASTSTYAYLKSINGKRENIIKDLQHTQAYQEYLYFKVCVKELQKLWGEEWWSHKKNLFNKKQNMSAQSFKNWFINRCRVYLDRYFHYMVTAAALYYDEHEDKKMSPDFVITGGKAILK